MSGKRKHRTTLEYLRYLKGELSREERHSFERDLESDPFEREAMEGMESQTSGAIEEDLLSLHASLHRRLRRRRRRQFYYVAASVASLLIVGTIFLTIYNVNPKTASESIPRDESFLHEQDDVTEDRIPEPEESLTDEGPADEGAQEKGPPAEANQEERTVPAEANQEEKAQRGAAVQFDAAQEAEEPEVVAVEAHPIPSRKKENLQEVPMTEQEAPTTEPNVTDLEPHAAAALAMQEAGDQEKAAAPMPAQQDEVMNQKAAAPMPAHEAEALIREAAAPMRRDAIPGRINRVSGVVVSAENMKPLPEATILVKDRDTGLVADMQGRFSLEANPQDQTTVIASFVGMEPGEYRLDDLKENRLILEPDTNILDDVIVLDYEDIKRKLATVRTEPEGGLDAFKMYIEEQIRFPAGDTTDHRKTVVLRFHVLQDGTLSGIQSLRSPGEAFTEEAIRLLKEGPGWLPARNENGPMDEVVRMRFVFVR